MEIPKIEVLVAEEKPKKKGGRRVGAGRPSLVRKNNERIAKGLEPLPHPRKKQIQKSEAILPEKKKARSQEILAQMLGKKSQDIVHKVLNKALNDEDPDQMACLKMVMDRVIPADYLTKQNNKSSAITIQIMGVDAKIPEVESIDAEFDDVES
tara:strand:- start:331 stop:789 length:459 start_codon:yes stop_codon:yes gene_type:complete